MCLQLLEVDVYGVEMSHILISEGMCELVTNLESCSKMSAACAYSRSPFLTVESLLPSANEEDEEKKL